MNPLSVHVGLFLVLATAIDYARPVVAAGQAIAGAACALPEASVITRQGDDVLLVWELPSTSIWFSDTMPDAQGYQAYRTAIRAAGGDDAKPAQGLTPPKDEADRVIIRNEEHNFRVMYSGGGEVRPIRCLEAELFAFQDARYSQLVTPTEFIAQILRKDARLKVYFGSSNGMFPPRSVYGLERVAADVAQGWQYWALLHNHTVRTIDGKPVPGVPAPRTSDVQFFKAQAERLGLREMWVTNGIYTGVVPVANLSQFRGRD